MDTPNKRLAYLVGHYPGVSLTFILREVLLIREAGIRVETVSINPAEPSQDGFTDTEQAEQRGTFYVKTRKPLLILGDHLRCLVSRPARYIRGLMHAAWLGGTDPRTLVLHLLYFAEAVVLGEWMIRRNLRHVHVHFAVNTATVALIASRIYPVRYSISVHGPNEFYGVEQYRLREKIAGAAFLCCIGQYCRSQLMRISDPRQWNKLHIVRLGVDPEVFRPVSRPSRETVSILCVGRLVPEKGQAILLQATSLLVQNGRNVHVQFAGNGPSRQMLEELARTLDITSAVTFHGSVNQTRLRELLESTDIFVLPSFAEGIPVALMEAMSMEIPCVSTFVAGIPELIHSGQDGLLVPPSDAQLLFEALDELVQDSDRRSDLGKAGRQTVMQRYNLRPNVQRLAEVFTANLPSSHNANT